MQANPLKQRFPSVPVARPALNEPDTVIVTPSRGCPFAASVTVPFISPVVGLVERGVVPRFMIEPATIFTAAVAVAQPEKEKFIFWLPADRFARVNAPLMADRPVSFQFLQ